MTIALPPLASLYPDLATLPFDAESASSRRRRASVPPPLTWDTPEALPQHHVYTAADLIEVKHLGGLPGVAPYVRGPYATMYVERPWTVRQYAGFSTAEASNAFYRKNLAAGQMACPSPSTSPPIAATTRTIRAWSAMSAWPAWPSTRSSTCARCSAASRSTR